ncbi:MAG: hypothetical protein GXP05_15825 [Alphaproteobacteria bacterium]|nr:hypothetical protein [Alphaproteobacteria bacterium]
MRVGRLFIGSVLATFAVTTLMSSAALAEIYIPEGKAGTALRLTSEFEPAGRIKGLGNVHGLDVALSRDLLISASLMPVARDGAKKDGQISLIDLKTGKIIRRIEVPGVVHHVTVGANDRYVLLTHPKLKAVSILDLETNKITATIKTGPNPNYAVYDPKTKSFFVSVEGKSTIDQIDPTKGEIVNIYKTPAGAEHLAIDVAGRRLFAAEVDAGVLSVMNLDTGAIEDTYQIGGKLHGVAYDATRDAVYVSARENGKIAWIDLATKKMSVEKVGPGPYHMALDGNRLVVSSAKNNVVWVVDVTTRKIVKTIPTSARAHQMAVIPNS